MSVGKIAVVAAVPTDRFRLILGDKGTPLSRPDVRAALSARCALDIAWHGPGIGEFGPVRLECRIGPDALGLPEFFELAETMLDRLANRDVIGVATAVVLAVGRPELAKLRAAMQTIPVEADNVGRRFPCQRWLGEPLHNVKLLWWTATEDVDMTARQPTEWGDYAYSRA